MCDTKIDPKEPCVPLILSIELQSMHKNITIISMCCENYEVRRHVVCNAYLSSLHAEEKLNPNRMRALFRYKVCMIYECYGSMVI